MAAKKRVALGALVVGGVFLARETFSALWSVFLDFVLSRGSGVTIASLPWRNIIGVTLVVIGLIWLFWPSKKAAKADPYSRLATRAEYLVMRFRNQRKEHWIRHDLEPLGDVCRDGLSTMIMFAEAGFHVPKFATEGAERVAVGMEFYFATLFPFLRDGHVDMAKAQSGAIAERAVAEAAALKITEYIQRDL